MIRAIALCLLIISAPMAVRAQSEDIEAVIGAQLDAFRADDFETAFTFASPMIKRMFGTPERFGQMVMNGYPMVWRPANVVFGGLQDIEGRLVKTVFFTDGAGRTYEAAYEMIETEGGWQINGVYIREADIGA